MLVYNGKIIGEGYHKIAGKEHAEVKCLASVSDHNRALIPLSTLYVSLEPCCFHGRTPACTDLILRSDIQTVVIGQLDQTPRVSGQGVEILRNAGKEVRIYPDHEGCRKLAGERNLFVTQHRPYIILKWAQSTDGFMAPNSNEPYWISSALTRRLTHKWRSQTGAILVGAATVLADDPSLTTRFYPGKDPVRVVFDPRNRCTGHERVFQVESDSPTLWFSSQAPNLERNASTTEHFVLEHKEENWLPNILDELYRRGINQLTVEGGAYTLGLFLKMGLVDEIRRITNTQLAIGDGLPAPHIAALANKPGQDEWRPAEVQKIDTDQLETFRL